MHVVIYISYVIYIYITYMYTCNIKPYYVLGVVSGIMKLKYSGK